MGDHEQPQSRAMRPAVVPQLSGSVNPDPPARVQQPDAAAVAAGAPSKGAERIINAEKKVFYRSNDDSEGANCLRRMRCGCLEPRYVLTTEAIKIEEWDGCERRNHSVDIDNIVDLSLQQNCSVGYCMFGRGHITLYTKVDGKDDIVVLRHIENAYDVFQNLSSHIHKVNNLKYGMRRPTMNALAFVLYDSKHDPWCIKCQRTVLNCNCCYFPHTIISKERITTSKWEGCHKETLQFDVDNIQNINLHRSVFESCCWGMGKLHIFGSDMDQSGLEVTHVSSAKAVFQHLDEYVKVLNNRNRVVGDHMAR